jgi:DNA-directed RNA polymerase specialized sigma24 family protein
MREGELLALRPFWSVPAPRGDARPAVHDERERRLIERARTDRDAFAVLYREHYEAIGGYLFRRIGDVHASEDLLGDVFLSALQALPRFEPRGVPFRAWLLRIATYAANRWARANGRRPRPLSERAEVVDGAASGTEAHDLSDERSWVQLPAGGARRASRRCSRCTTSRGFGRGGRAHAALPAGR